MNTGSYPPLRRSMVLSLTMLFLLAGVINTRPARAATATLEPTSVTNGYDVRSGNRFIVRGSGFNDGEWVSTWASFSLRPTVYATGEAQADRSGNVSIEIKTGRFWEPGWWAMTLSSHDSSRQAIAGFKIVAAPPDGTLDREPIREMRRGERINFHGAGFNQNENIKIWVTRPDGNALAIETGITQRGGDVNFSYDIPGDALPGRWSATVYGQSSERLLIRDFDVIP
jgi:hypothetical protein